MAAGGDERGFRESFENAERIRQPSEPSGHGFFARYLAADPDEGSGIAGIGLVRVGRAEEAVAALQTRLDPARPVSAVIAGADIAYARVLQGEPEQACRELGRALDLALDAGYLVGVERIRGVRASFPASCTHLACVRELDEVIR